MVISAIHLQNFKSFFGETKIESLDSQISDNQNIVLFGGINGAGKTTFLEAIFLCFYGIHASKLYPSKGAKHEPYTSYIFSLLNNKVRESGIMNATMSVEVFLNDVPITSNIPRNISLKRVWQFPLSNQVPKFDSHFEILEDGKPIEELDEREYQDRIEAILPYNVSQFFFFDGEKIQDFASDSDLEFAASLKDVLGINLYAKLSEDIKEVRARIVTEFNKNKESSVQIAERNVEKARLESEIDNFNSEIDTLNDEIGDLDVKIDLFDVETKRVTRISVSSREEYELERSKAEGEKAILESEYFEYAVDYLPFVLSSSLFPSIENQLNFELKIKRNKAAQAAVEPQIESIIDFVFNANPPPSFDMTKAIKRYFELKIDSALRTILGSDTEGVGEDDMIHNLLEADGVKAIQFFSKIDEDVTRRINKTTDKLKQVNLVLDKIRSTEIRSGSNTDIIQQLFDEMDRLKESRTIKSERIKQLKENIENNQKKLEICLREITNWEKRADVSGKHKKQMDYADKMLLTIKEFQKRFQATRTKELETEILWMWNQLTHKPNWIKTISINPDANFEIRLFNNKKTEIDKTKMSAGEKEIFAIALLWALSKVSGKRLPIVIDTPFGRLDSVHRNNISLKYFPKASHQVILLSQDEEITDEYYGAIKPHIAKELHRKY